MILSFNIIKSSSFFKLLRIIFAKDRKKRGEVRARLVQAFAALGFLIPVQSTGRILMGCSPAQNPIRRSA